MTELEKIICTMFAGILIILIISLTLGAVLLPSDNPSHELNPFSYLYFWLIDDSTNIDTFISYALPILIFGSLFISITWSFIKKRKDEMTA